MPLPPTRYIDAGPGAPLANPNSAMAQGEAMARMGQTIQHIGAMGFDVAERVRKIDEAGKMSALFSNMEKEAADFRIGLMRREDTSAWSGEWQEKSAHWEEAAKAQKLSPEGNARFQERFAAWNTQHTISLETTAASKRIELGKARTSNSLAYYFDNQKWDEARREAADARQSGLLTTPDYDKLLQTIGKEERHSSITADITENPREWKKLNPVDKPPADYDPNKWLQMHNFADSMAAEQDGVLTDGVLDEIVTNKTTTADEVRKKTANLRPMQQQKLLNALDNWNAEGAKAAREDPKNIAKNVGKFYAELSNWTPDAEGTDPDGVELRMIMEDVPEGHPLRDKMKESMTARKSRIDDTIRTRADQGMATLKLAAERGVFGQVKPPVAKKVETRKAVADGFLQDIPKLQSLGFSQSQAEDVRELAKKDPALGQEKFNELWKTRPQDSVNATPFDVAVADAIRLENGTVQWDSDIPSAEVDAHEKAVKAYGEAMIEFETWSKLNPKATEAEMGTKLKDLGAKSVRLAPVTTGPVKRPPARATTALPGETSMKRDANVNPNVYDLWDKVSAKLPSVGNWGIWGDDKHQARKSDHNTGDAIDIAIMDNDGASVTDEIVANATAHNVKYMIHDGRIWKPSTGWKTYEGKDSHSGHVHVSFSRPDTSTASK